MATTPPTPSRRLPRHAAPHPRPQVHRLLHRPLAQGSDWWVLDDVLADPMAVRARLLARPESDWTLGAPHRPESWPGRRALPALLPDELAPIEAWVRQQTGAKRLFQPPPAALGASAGNLLNHNCVQLVGVDEAGPRPHTDSRALCKYAAVLYLSPDIPAHAGTSFFQARLPDGRPGGNAVSTRHANLVEALGTRFVPPDLFQPELAVNARFNRLLLYRADLIHSASSYFGTTNETRRMTAVFFWQAV